MFGFVWVRNKAFQGDVSEFQVLDSGTPSSIRIRFCGSNSVPAVTGMP